MTDVTPAQRAMLALVTPDTLRRQPARWTGDDMLRHLPAYHHTTQGVHMTAASLVRRGYLEKLRVRITRGRPPVIAYRVTRTGREMLDALRSLDKAARR
jgi:hypothetical protein